MIRKILQRYFARGQAIIIPITFTIKSAMADCCSIGRKSFMLNAKLFVSSIASSRASLLDIGMPKIINGKMALKAPALLAVS